MDTSTLDGNTSANTSIISHSMKRAQYQTIGGDSTPTYGKLRFEKQSKMTETEKEVKLYIDTYPRHQNIYFWLKAILIITFLTILTLGREFGLPDEDVPKIDDTL